MSVQERREREKVELRQRIVDAARELFVSEGYENVSMRKIAEKIDYSPTTIYLYFEDKAALLHSVCEKTQLNMLDTLQTLFEDLSDPVETLRKCSRAYADFGLGYPEDYKLTFIVGPHHQTGLGLPEGSAAKRMFNYLHAVVKECIRQKRFRQVDVETASQAIWSAVHGVTSLLITYPDFPWVEKDGLITQVIDTMIDGFRV